MSENLTFQHTSTRDSFNKAKAGLWNINNGLVKVPRNTGIEIPKTSELELSDSACASTFYDKGQADNVKDKTQTQTQNSCNPVLGASFVSSEASEIPSRSRSSGACPANGAATSSHFILRTANESSQTLPAERLPDSNHKSPSYSTSDTFHPSTSLGYPVFQSSSTETDQNKKVINEARSKTSELQRSSHRQPKPNNEHKSVTWSENITRIVDEETYQEYRQYLLDLKTPNNRSKLAAIRAVTFILDTDEGVSKSLIDMGFKLFWLNYNRYPSGVELYSLISEFNFDEKCLVMQFIEECDTKKGRFTAKSLFNGLDDTSIPDANNHPGLQNGLRQTNLVSAETVYKAPLDRINSVPSSLRDSHFTAMSTKSTAVRSTHNTAKARQSTAAKPTHHTTESAYHAEGISAQPTTAKTAQATTAQLNNFSSSFESFTTTQQQFPDAIYQHQENLSDFKFLSMEGHASSYKNSQDQEDHADTSGTQQNPSSSQEYIEVLALKREQEYLKQTLLCVLCKKKQIEVTLLPCGHFVLCATCSDECNICPICKKRALAELKTFLG